MDLPPISDEQLAVLNHIETGKNVIVDSVAGSGKTTCNLHMATRFPDKNILLLTYNARLKLETREKVKLLNLTNLEVHSYHSFCVTYYNRNCYNDKAIRTMLKNEDIDDEPIMEYLSEYDIIVIDETQDMSPLYYELVCKIRKNNEKSVQLAIFGDNKQCIFSFMDADQRYIEMADQLYGNREWVKCCLSTSFRLTDHVGAFVNNCMLGNNRIQTVKTSNFKPHYIVRDYFSRDGIQMVYDEILKYKALGYKDDDMFVLASSIKNTGRKSSPIIRLENMIKNNMEPENKIMVFVPSSDEESLNRNVIAHKLVFSTFHQTKGLERKIIFIFGFDDSYFRYYNKSANINVCPNELYVATTRSAERLILLHHKENSFLPFILKENLNKFCDMDMTHISNQLELQKNKKIKLKHKYSVTSLLKFIHYTDIDRCKEKLNITKLQECDVPINIRHVAANGIYNENVSNITGIAVAAMSELQTTGKMKIYESLVKNSQHGPYVSKIDLNTITPSSLLNIANRWDSLISGYIFKIKQIEKYNWLSQVNLEKCLERFKKLNVSKNGIHEYEIKFTGVSHLNKFVLMGSIDCYDPDSNTVYEFKCVNELRDEHFLQLALYAFLFEYHKIKESLEIKNKTKYKLFNVITNECYQISASFEDLTSIVNILVSRHHFPRTPISDENFMTINENIMMKYLPS